MDVDFTWSRPGTNSQVGRRRGRDFEESIPSHGVGVSVVSTQMNNHNNLIDQIDGPVSSIPANTAAPVMTSENFPSLGGRKALGNSTSSMSLYMHRFKGAMARFGKNNILHTKLCIMTWSINFFR